MVSMNPPWPVATSSTLPPEIDPSLSAILGASDDSKPFGKRPTCLLTGANLTSYFIILAEMNPGDHDQSLRIGDGAPALVKRLGTVVDASISQVGSGPKPALHERVTKRLPGNLTKPKSSLIEIRKGAPGCCQAQIPTAMPWVSRGKDHSGGIPRQLSILPVSLPTSMFCRLGGH